jgi:hypothetical protein
LGLLAVVSALFLTGVALLLTVTAFALTNEGQRGHYKYEEQDQIHGSDSFHRSPR